MIASYFPLLLWKCNVNILMHAYLNFQGNLQIDLNKLQICSHALCSIWTNCIHYICGSWEHFSNVKLKIQIVAQPWPWGVVWTNFYTTYRQQTLDTQWTDLEQKNWKWHENEQQSVKLIRYELKTVHGTTWKALWLKSKNELQYNTLTAKSWGHMIFIHYICNSFFCNYFIICYKTIGNKNHFAATINSF